MTTQQKQELNRLFGIMGNADSWDNLEDLVKICDKAKYWSPRLEKSAVMNAKKAHLRKALKIKDEEGMPLFASIVTEDENGKKVRRYKQEALFDVEDYRQVAQYHMQAADHHTTMSKNYIRRCKTRFNVQLRFDFDKGTVEKPRGRKQPK